MTKEAFYTKWEISTASACQYRKKIKQELGFCEYKHINIFLEDRLNVLLLAQQLMLNKGAIDILDFFSNYMSAYRFISTMFEDKKIITNNMYYKCMLIINKFEDITIIDDK